MLCKSPISAGRVVMLLREMFSCSRDTRAPNAGGKVVKLQKRNIVSLMAYKFPANLIRYNEIKWEL